MYRLYRLNCSVEKHDLSKFDKPRVILNLIDGFFDMNTIHFHESTKAKDNSAYVVEKEALFKDKL